MRRMIAFLVAVLAVLALCGAEGGCESEQGKAPTGHVKERPPQDNPDPAPKHTPCAKDEPACGARKVIFQGLWTHRLFGVKGAWNFGAGQWPISQNEAPFRQEVMVNAGQAVSMTLVPWVIQGWPRNGSMSCRLTSDGVQIDFDSNEDNDLKGGVTCSGVAA